MSSPTAAGVDDDGALLRLIWLASPALPVGAFSYSDGLEAAVEAGRVADEAGARRWLLDHLHLVQARADLPVAAAALRAWQRHDIARAEALNRWVRTTRESAEFRLQTEQTGRSLADWLRQRALESAGAIGPGGAAGTDGADDTPTPGGAPGATPPPDPRIEALRGFAPAPTWPVAWALAAARSGAPERAALLAMAFSWAENAVQAAVKSVPLGQSAGQRLLAALAGAIPAAVDEAIGRAGRDDAVAFTPMLAILSARHEAQYSRLFRS